MTLEDFISRFNSAELHRALKTQGLPNVGNSDDKITQLANLTNTKSKIKFLLSNLDEVRLREISLEFAISGAGTMNKGKLMNRIAQIMIGDYQTLEQQAANIENLHSLTILAVGASILMIVFIFTAFFFGTSGSFIAAVAISIPASFYAYITIKRRLQNPNKKPD